MNRSTQLAVLSSILIPRVGLAELHNCDGVISDRPCNEIKADQSTLSVVKKATEDSELREKKSLMHDFTMKALKARRERSIKVELKPIEDFCYLGSTSPLDCQERINSAEDRMNKQILEAQSVEEQKRANELKERENAILEERNEIELRKKSDRIIVINKNKVHVHQEQSQGQINAVPRHHDHRDSDREDDEDELSTAHGEEKAPQPFLTEDQKKFHNRHK